MNPIAEVKKRREEKKAELAALGFTFSPVITFESLSIDEMTDLAALQIGDAVYIIDSGDVTRTA